MAPAVPVDSIIFAVASPPGRSSRGILRASGAGVFNVLAQRALAPWLGTFGANNSEPGTFSRGVFRARLRLEAGDLPVLLLMMPGPRSYTGEDAAEIQMPGSPALLERVIDLLLADAREHGVDARRAEPGEFTARAYFNGRMNLTQAEGVAATIAAQNDAALRAAGLLRRGALGEMATRLADRLASALALVEAGIDFTDQEDVIAITPADLHERLRSLRDDLSARLERSVGMEQLEAAPWVVLRGRANAGKSTLFNALLGRERAVVSEIAGTTRDALIEPLRIETGHGEAEVMLVDIAGAEDADGSLLRRLMQESAGGAAERAELILHCVPADAPLEAEQSSPGEVIVRTKADLAAGRDLPGEMGSGAAGAATRRVGGPLALSARTGRGLDEVRRLIAARLGGQASSLAADAMALTPRHQAGLAAALESIDEAVALVKPIVDQRALADAEIVAASMRTALDHLAALAGAITPDEVLGRIFATFCVGK